MNDIPPDDLPQREPVALYVKRRSLPDQLRYLAGKLTEGAATAAVALALRTIADEQEDSGA